MSRYCTNCRAEVPDRADACPACGVFAGDVFDGTWPPRKRRTKLWLSILVLAVVAAGAANWFERRTAAPAGSPALPPVRVVADRPGGSRRAAGAKVTEAEAVRLLRRHLVATIGIRNDCIALIVERGRPDYSFVARDHCADVRLGRWQVDPASGTPHPLRPE